MTTSEKLKTTAAEQAKELLLTAVLYEDRAYINGIHEELLELQANMLSERSHLAVAELCVKWKNYNKLEVMPFAIISLMPMKVQLDYIASMVSSPMNALRWLFFTKQFNSKEYAKAHETLPMLTIKFRDSPISRDKLMEITDTPAKLQDYFRTLIKDADNKIQQTRRQMGRYNSAEDLTITKEDYERTIPKMDIIDLLYHATNAIRQGISPTFVRQHLTSAMFTTKNVIITKFFTAIRVNITYMCELYKEQFDKDCRTDAGFGYRHIKPFPEICEYFKDKDECIVPHLEFLLHQAINGLRKIPGNCVIAIDCSGSMKGSSVGDHIPYDIRELAQITAYQNYWAFEKPHVVLTAGTDPSGGSNISYLIKDKMPTTLMAFMQKIRDEHEKSGIGTGGIFLKPLFKFIADTKLLHSKDNVIVYCDSGDGSIAHHTGKDKALHCNTFICNVEYGLNGRGVERDFSMVDFYVKGHSSYLLEYIAMQNGISSVYEKSASLTGATARDLF